MNELLDDALIVQICGTELQLTPLLCALSLYGETFRWAWFHNGVTYVCVKNNIGELPPSPGSRTLFLPSIIFSAKIGENLEVRYHYSKL